MTLSPSIVLGSRSGRQESRTLVCRESDRRNRIWTRGQPRFPWQHRLAKLARSRRRRLSRHCWPKP